MILDFFSFYFNARTIETKLTNIDVVITYKYVIIIIIVCYLAG